MLFWFGGMAVLFVRFRLKQHAYIHHFENELRFLAGSPLYIPSSAQGVGDALRVMRQRQSDPDLEKLRRNMWRRYLFIVLWVFGFPVAVIALVVLVKVTTGVLVLQ